ncbi:CotZ-related putative spore coat protein [Ureibacillus sinduriensis]|uniref:Endospore appendages core domain-containing protein n=1 Tax=Ureibacillus sinduriensis BLB-1 = JCM 15800 TaxID=1384057 RepID=A0A0A3IN89_9BACL|nr:CotZ-related putative spore coat protein [Ureibacillus sinduriensis]KGR76277.1 hypothetical protein CD33_06945 [Ureibacillus sinduriensis BLB-1 = JCM 15800]
MSKGIKKRVKQFERNCINFTEFSQYTELPFHLLNSKGHPFFAIGQIDGFSFKSPFFTVESVDPCQHSAVLNILAPFPFQEGDVDPSNCIQTLLRTNSFVSVELSKFSGFSKVPISISDCLTICDMMEEHVRLPFMAGETDFPKVIWQHTGGNQINNVATIMLHYQNGIDSQVKLNLCTKDKLVTLNAPKGNGRAVTVKDLLSIEICPSAKLVKGIIEIQVNRKEERKIYFN